MTGQLLIGDALAELQKLPDGAAQCCVTSPPYFGLRAYLPAGAEGRDLEVGTEKTPEAFVARLVAVFREVKRVLRPDGTLWLNLGASYASEYIFSERVKMREDLTEDEREFVALELSRSLYGVRSADGQGTGEGPLPELLQPTSQNSLPIRPGAGAEAKGLFESVPCETSPGTEPSNRTAKSTNAVEDVGYPGGDVCLLRGEGNQVPLPRPHKGRRAPGLSEGQRPAQRVASGDSGGFAEGQVSRAVLELQLSPGALRLLSSLRVNITDLPTDLHPYFESEDVLKPKDLINIPHMVVEALRADGWYFRAEIIWHKTAPMPESVSDRPTRAHEQVFLLSKKPSYFYDSAAIAETVSSNGLFHGSQTFKSGANGDRNDGGRSMVGEDSGTRNKRSVWTLGPSQFSGPHYATYPPALITPMILAGTSERGCCPACGAPWVRCVERNGGVSRDRPLTPKHVTAAAQGVYHAGQDKSGLGRPGWRDDEPRTVETTGWSPSCACPPAEPEPCVILDPFMGSGTTAQEAQRLGRRWIGIELNPANEAMIWQRAAQTGFAFPPGGGG